MPEVVSDSSYDFKKMHKHAGVGAPAPQFVKVACYTHPWVAFDTHMGVDLLDQKLEWRRRDLVGRGWHFCMPGHRLILLPMSKPGGALPACYTHCCFHACPCSACCGFCSLLWSSLVKLCRRPVKTITIVMVLTGRRHREINPILPPISFLY